MNNRIRLLGDKTIIGDVSRNDKKVLLGGALLSVAANHGGRFSSRRCQARACVKADVARRALAHSTNRAESALVRGLKE